MTREVPSDRRIRTEVILREPFVAALPESHRLASEQSIAVAELAAEPFVLFRREIAPALRDQILGICITGGFAPGVVQEADEWHTIFAFVRSGFGITLPPASLCRLNWPGLTFHNLTHAEAQATISLCWTPDRLSPATAALIDFLRSRTRENGGAWSAEGAGPVTDEICASGDVSILPVWNSPLLAFQT